MRQFMEECQCPVIVLDHLVLLKSCLAGTVGNGIAKAAAFEESIAEVDQRIAVPTVVTRVG